VRFGGKAYISLVIASLLATSLPAPAAAAQPGTITTVAGGAGQGPATQVAQNPGGLVMHGSALLVADAQYGVVRSIDASSHSESLFAGTCPGYSGDGGPATAAGVTATRVTSAADGTVYIVDAINMVVRKVDSNGTISTFAGKGGTTGAFAGDGGPATQANLNVPTGVAVDSAGNVYIADRGNGRVRKVNTSGIITTVAGSGVNYGPDQDGLPATQVTLHWPQTVAIDKNGDLLISDENRIRRVTGGIMTTVSGSGAMRVAGMAVDQLGNIYYADEYGAQVKMAGSGGVIAGSGQVGYSGDGGPAVAAKLMSPEDVAVDASGNVYIADQGNYRVRVVSAGTIRTYAGTGSATTGDGGPASQASVADPSKVAFDSQGNYYFAELSHHKVRKVDTNGVIVTVAGNGTGGFSGDGGPATQAELWEPRSVVVDASDNLLIADSRNGRIRRVDHNGIITTIAGGGSAWADNVPATATTLAYPWGLAFDHLGRLYVAEPYNAAVVRRIDGQGMIRVVAGGNTSNDPGDGSLATNAYIGRIEGIALDASDNLYIADTANHHTIRRVDHATGIITTFAGRTFIPGYAGDGGPATSAALNFPNDVAVAPNGDLFIADGNNHRVRRVSGGVITTFAGTGAAGCTGDGGPPDAAQLSWPSGVTFDPAGNLYISHDTRIREVFSATPRQHPTTLVFPVLMNRAFGGYTTTIYVENASGGPLAAGAITISYYDRSGASVGPGDSSPVLANGAVWVVAQSNGHSFADGGAGTGVLRASDRVTAFTNQEIPGGDGSAYDGQPPYSYGATLYAPAILNNAYGQYSTGIGTMNASESSLTATVTYRSAEFSQAGSETSRPLAPNAFWSTYQGGLGSPPAGFVGNAVISSDPAGRLAAIVNEVGSVNGQFMTYAAGNEPVHRLYAPVILNHAFGGYSTGIGLQTVIGVVYPVNIDYTGFVGDSTTVQTFHQSVSPPSGGSTAIYNGAATDNPLPPGFHGSATITSDQPTVAIVNEVKDGSGFATSYNAVAGGSEAVDLPLVENSYNGFSTGIGIENVGSGPATVAITYRDPVSGATIGHGPTLTLAPGEYAGVYQGPGGDGGVPPGVRASAALRITDRRDGGKLAVIVNQQSATSFMSYSGE
jgi:sugar lactone lactonase YvrE